MCHFCVLLHAYSDLVGKPGNLFRAAVWSIKQSYPQMPIFLFTNGRGNTVVATLIIFIDYVCPVDMSTNCLIRILLLLFLFAVEHPETQNLVTIVQIGILLKYISVHMYVVRININSMSCITFFVF